MNAEETVAWLNERDPLQQWSVGEDMFCLHCDGVFKAEDVACDDVGDPTCPLCMSSTPLDFGKIPWWREDLVEQSATKNRMINTWLVEPIRAIPGKPCRLPPRKADERI